jgi:pyruvate/2-oxoglutarate/acetoin dehydrogenase E1 component
MGKTVAETIKEITKTHLNKNNGVVMGQCLSAVGWVQNTIPPQKKRIIELQMTDVAGAGFAVGSALAGANPIFVLRFQSFLWLNSSPIVMHAAKTKEMFGYNCPVFIRAIASEGVGSGPLHSNCYHSPFAHMPGLPIAAPMTPNEYKDVWKFYRKNKTPILVSEHRISYKSNKEFKDEVNKNSKISFFVISAGRFNMEKVKKILQSKNISCDIFHIMWIKPFKIKKTYLDSLKKTKKGIVIDSSYEICSVAEHIAYKLMNKVNATIEVQGMKDYSPGASVKLNLTPTPEKIVKSTIKLINK